jgi:hypothetical protein
VRSNGCYANNISGPRVASKQSQTSSRVSPQTYDISQYGSSASGRQHRVLAFCLAKMQQQDAWPRYSRLAAYICIATCTASTIAAEQYGTL